MTAARMNADNADAVLALLDQADMRDAEARDLAPVTEELQQLKEQGSQNG